jgi:3-hydroxybutyryl-CoA dehydrogenase
MITNIAVIGAGTMGYGIAMNFALAGCAVRLVDVDDAALGRATDNIRSAMTVFEEEGLHTRAESDAAIRRIAMHTGLAEALCDAHMAIESLPESLALKHEILCAIDALAAPDCILVTNTSGLRLAEVMQPLSAERKRYCLLAHYFNPAQIIPLVELLTLPETLPETLARIEDLYRRAGKVTIRVKKDVPGMAGNRIQGAICREALWLLENDVCSGEDLGKMMMFGPCFRYASVDYLQIIDMGGLDLWYAVYERMFKDLNSSIHASTLLRDKAAAGERGWKSGKGFHSYDGDKKDEALRRYIHNLAKQLKVSENYKPACD